eukprot:SAG22_NODE_95_length_20791_cov_40.318514_7_plen_780_part_00
MLLVFNRKNALKLLNINLLDDETKYELKKYMSFASNGGKGNVVNVKYTVNEIGRLDITVIGERKGGSYSEPCTVQSYMWRPVKAALCADTYTDIDIVNAHPVFILQLFAEQGFGCEHLRLYVTNRQTFLDQFKARGVDRDAAKKLLMAVLYGGGFKSWCREFKVAEEIIPQLFHDLKKEVAENTGRLLMVPGFAKYFQYATLKKGASHWNLPGSALSFIAQTVECRCLLAMRQFFGEQGFVVGALIHDGLHVESGDELDAQLLAECAAAVQQATGFEVALVAKPFELPPELTAVTVVEHQKAAADFMSEQIQPRFKMCQEVLFVKSDGIWHMSPKAVRRILQDVVGGFDIYEETEKGLKIINKTAPQINQIIEMLRGEPDPNFLDSLWQSNLGKLCFDDGYFDFAQGKFVPGFDGVMTTTKIHRAFPPRDEAAILEVYEQVLNPIFDDNVAMRDHFLHYTARGLAGHIEDKAWAIGQGERNCGKGVLGTCLHNAFQSYINTTNSENFMMKASGAGGDMAKQLSWLVDFIFVRIMITNEITIDAKGTYVVNGNTLKKLSSGGDVIEGRKNYQDELKFKVQSRPLLFCNDVPPIEPKDALDTCTVFKFPCQFVDDVSEGGNDLVRLRPTDKDIKAKCATDKFIDAFTHIILDHYDSTAHPPPPCIVDDQKEFKSDGGSDNDIILRAFKKSTTSCLRSSDVHLYINEKLKVAISPQKIKALLSKSMGVEKKQHGTDRLQHYININFTDDSTGVDTYESTGSICIPPVLSTEVASPRVNPCVY